MTGRAEDLAGATRCCRGRGAPWAHRRFGIQVTLPEETPVPALFRSRVACPRRAPGALPAGGHLRRAQRLEEPFAWWRLAMVNGHRLRELTGGL